MSYSEEIGGFFALELPPAGTIFHDQSIKLNSGRNCFRYVIRAYGIKTIYLPYYTCPVIWDSAKAEGCAIQYYSINMNFMPIKDFPTDAFILYTNYFGICSQNVAKLARKYKNLIVDNAQAYFMPSSGLSSFYSPRKFFGVPDGGLLYCGKILNEHLLREVSHRRCAHLLRSLDSSAQAAYGDFQANEETISNISLRKMSHLTKRILSSIDYEAIQKKRLLNFAVLHSHLGTKNALKIQLGDDDVPMAYPFFSGESSLRKKLIQHKIYVPQYWPGIEYYCPQNDITSRFHENISPLPCDQRYSVDEMQRICHIIASSI